MRKKRMLSAAAALGLAIVLSGCASSQAGDARPLATQEQRDESAKQVERDRTPVQPEPSPSDDVLDPPPDHLGMEPPYEPQQLWPDAGAPEFPTTLGNGFTGGTEISDSGMFISTLYSDDDYNLVSVRLSDTYFNYNGRDLVYEGFRYVDGVLCAASVGSDDGEIMSRACWLVGSDGVTWATSYSASVTYDDLAGYLQTIYDHLAANAREE